MKKTITRDEIVAKLKEGVVFFTFEKVDGTTRPMNATLNEAIIPFEPTKGEGEQKSANSKRDSNALPVWDCDNNSWRSFRLDKLLDFDGEEVVYGAE